MMNNIFEFLNKYPFLAILFSLMIGRIIMPFVYKIAKDNNFVVEPNTRTSHSGRIPNIGGLNIFISFLITFFIFTDSEYSNQIRFALLGSFVILIIGLIDDLIEVNIFVKLFGQLLAGFFLIFIGHARLTNLHGFLGIHEISLFWSYLLSFFVYIVIVNAVNLIDGIDGLAAGLSVLYSIFFAVYFQFANHMQLAIISYSIAGALSIFFFYNVFSKKKKIFMGDSGSLLLGYILTFLIFSFCEFNAYEHVPAVFNMHAAPAVAFTILIVPLFDTIRVMLTRIKKGYSPFRADKNHVHHLLLSLGYNHLQATIILMIITVIYMTIAIICRNLPNEILILIDFSSCYLLTKWLWRLVDYHKINSNPQRR